jgi:outer membrane protein, multidrug efflux system
LSLKRHGLVVLSTVLGTAGCASMAPRYQRPAPAVPAQWPVGAAYQQPPTAGARAATELPWQDFILDARLRQVVAQSLKDSRTLREQAAAVLSARAQYRVQRAQLLPALNAGVSNNQSRQVLEGFPGFPGTFAYTAQTDEATVGLTSWEIDLFGRLRSLSRAALETYLSSSSTLRAARINLIAEVASAWATLAADRSQLAIARGTALAAENAMKLTQQRLDRGVASAVDVREAETVYQTARADIANYVTVTAQDRNALELLVGSPVADDLLPDQLPEGDAWLADVQAGLSSAVVLQRPDVLAAEHDLQSANWSIGAARAAFLPQLTLTGDGGVASASLSSLVNQGSTIWSIGPTLSVPLFAGGANLANLDYAKAQKVHQVAAYELALQTAFQEVANALARRGTMQEQLAAREALVKAASGSFELATARYSQGVDTYLNALDAQRTLYSAQSALVSDRLTALDNRVELYRALGGGLADKSGT